MWANSLHLFYLETIVNSIRSWNYRVTLQRLVLNYINLKVWSGIHPLNHWFKLPDRCSYTSYKTVCTLVSTLLLTSLHSATIHTDSLAAIRPVEWTGISSTVVGGQGAISTEKHRFFYFDISDKKIDDKSTDQKHRYKSIFRFRCIERNLENTEYNNRGKLTIRQLMPPANQFGTKFELLRIKNYDPDDLCPVALK